MDDLQQAGALAALVATHFCVAAADPGEALTARLTGVLLAMCARAAARLAGLGRAAQLALLAAHAVCSAMLG